MAAPHFSHSEAVAKRLQTLRKMYALDLTPVEGLISKESKEKYYRYWNYYVKAQEITAENPPSKESLFEYLKDGFEGKKKYAATTLWTIFSCLNKMLQHLYDMDLSVSLLFIILLI